MTGKLGFHSSNSIILREVELTGIGIEISQMCL